MGRGRMILLHPGMMMGRGPRGPVPPSGRGPRGPMYVVWQDYGRGRGRPGGRIVIGPRGTGMRRGRGRPPPRPWIAMRPASGCEEVCADAATANAAPSWMRSVLQSNDDDDDDFKQPVPVSSSITVAHDTADTPAGGQISAVSASQRSRTRPYKPDPQDPPEGDCSVAVGQQDNSLGSGMSGWGEKSIPPAPVKAMSRRSV